MFTKNRTRQLETLQNTSQVRRNLLKSILSSNNLDDKIMLTRSALLSSTRSKYNPRVKREQGEKQIFGLSKAMSLTFPIREQCEYREEEDQTISVCQVKSQYVVECQSQTDFFQQNSSQQQPQGKESGFSTSRSQFQSNCKQKNENQNLTQSSIPNQLKESKLSNFNHQNEGLYKKFSQTAETLCSFSNTGGMKNSSIFKKKDICQQKIILKDERDEIIQKMRLKIEQMESQNKKWRNKTHFYKEKLRLLEQEIDAFHGCYQQACK